MRKTLLVIGTLLITALLVLGACAPAQMPKPTETGFFLTLETELVDNKLTIRGETNLPDGSWLAVHVDRLYKCEGETEWNSVCLAPRKVIVEIGKYSAGAVIYSEKWYDDLSKSFRERGIPPITEVSNKLSIVVIFSPVRFPQPDSVYEVVGQNGEKLHGEQVSKSSDGTFYILKATSEVYFPFSPE